MIRGVTIEIGNRTAFAQALKKAAEQVVLEKMKGVEARAVQIATADARRTYYQRPADRRGQSRLRYSNNFYSKRQAGGWPLRFSLANRATHAPILESGQRGHFIPNSTMPGGPSEHLGNNGVTNVDAFGAKKSTKVSGVRHPGAEGSHIMERALEAALREAGINPRRGVTSYIDG